MSQQSLLHHVSKKHDVKTRDNTGFITTTLTISGDKYDVLFNSNTSRYRCIHCTVDVPHINSITKHMKMKHIRTYQTRKENKEFLHQKKKENRVLCDICWKQFPCEQRYQEHANTYWHKHKQAYKQGTGCDDCRIEHSTKDTHDLLFVKKHKQMLENEELILKDLNNTSQVLSDKENPFGWCDICKKKEELIMIPLAIQKFSCGNFNSR